MSSAINKVKEALHLNKDHSTSTTHSTTGTTGTTHNSSVPEGTAGPHNSRVANAADPRVDSDLDSTRTGAVGTGLGSSTHNTTGTHSTGLGSSTHTGTHGTGAVGTGALGSGVTDHTGTTHTATGVHNTHGTGIGHSSTGPVHNSNIANKLDPRVDTTSTHTGTHTGIGSTGTHTGTGLGSSTHNTTGTHNTLGSTGTHGGISNSTNAGPHNSNLANKADPRVDSDLDGKGSGIGHQYGGLTGASGSHATPGSGTAQNTAGPHNSDLLNKLDPRVDADLDGSKTVGGNKTHA